MFPLPQYPGRPCLARLWPSDDDDGDGDDDPWSVGVGDESQTFNQSPGPQSLTQLFLYLPSPTQLLPGPQSLTQLLLLLNYSYSTLTRTSKSY